MSLGCCHLLVVVMFGIANVYKMIKVVCVCVNLRCLSYGHGWDWVGATGRGTRGIMRDVVYVLLLGLIVGCLLCLPRKMLSTDVRLGHQAARCLVLMLIRCCQLCVWSFSLIRLSCRVVCVSVCCCDCALAVK